MHKTDKNWTLFLDRDGVINEQIIGGYVLHFGQFKFNSGVIEALQQLRQLFGRIIIVTNQQCIGKGMCTQDAVNEVHRQMCAVLKQNNITVDGIYFCPHRADEGCRCRKPNTDLARQARKDFPDIDFKRSMMVGDAPSDMQFGRNCNMTTVFLTKGKTDIAELPEGIADFIYSDLSDFAQHIKHG